MVLDDDGECDWWLMTLTMKVADVGDADSDDGWMVIDSDSVT